MLIRGFVECLSFGTFQSIPLDEIGVLGLGEDGAYQRYIPSTCLVTVAVDLGQLAQVVSVRLPHYQVTLVPSLHSVAFGRKSPCIAPKLTNREL